MGSTILGGGFIPLLYIPCDCCKNKTVIYDRNIIAVAVGDGEVITYRCDWCLGLKGGGD